VASDQDSSEDLAGAAHEPRECMACRGSGQVISNLGGTPSKVTCPWCAGTGVRVPGIDAQARWPREESGAATTGDPAEADEGDEGDSNDAPVPAA
jgi:hypothetical protein